MADTARDDYGEPVPVKKAGHPTGFWFFFWGEFAERCSYYGMRAILYLYMTQRLMIDKNDAFSILMAFKFACYLLPLLGGYLADRYFGKYWTIVGFSVPYVLGQILIGFESQWMLYFALVLLACGSGVIKPNISSLMGMTYDQQRPGNISLRANAFLWFYFSINVGSTLSMLALPVVRTKFGYQIAFAFPAVLMALALVVFALGKRYYATETIGRRPVISPVERVEQRRVLFGLFGIFALMVLFWVVYEHNDSLWVEFANTSMHMPTLPDWLGGDEVKGDQFQFVNAALILALVPFSQWFWPKVDPTGTRFPHTTKIFLGFLFTGAAPVAMAIAAQLAADGTKVSVWWMVLAYFLLTVGEVLVYGTGLDLSYGYAPASLKGFVTACFLLTIAFGNLINMLFARAYKTVDADTTGFIDPASFFKLDAAIGLVAAIAFYFVGRKFSRAHRMV